MQSHPTIHKASFVASRKHVCRPAYETILFATELTRWHSPCNKIGQLLSVFLFTLSSNGSRSAIEQALVRWPMR